MLITLGSRGDVHPYIALGKELNKLGADCTICTGKGFDSEISIGGLKSATLNVDFRSLLTHEFIESTRTVGGLISAWRQTRGFQSHFLFSLWTNIQKTNPDVIIYHHNKGAPGLYAAIALGIPAIPTALIPAYLPTQEFNNPFSPLVLTKAVTRKALSRVLTTIMEWGMRGSTVAWRRKIRRERKIGVNSSFDGFHPMRKGVQRLHMFSSYLLPKPDDWPQKDIVSGYCFLDGSNEWAAPKDLVKFLNEGSKPIYFGFGSLPIVQMKKLVETIESALKRTGNRGLLLMDKHQCAEFDSTDTLFPLYDIPHEWLFPQCGIIIHHGGSGTTHQALRWGKPSVICPMFLDQPFWGRIANLRGAAANPIPFKELTSDRLVDGITQASSPQCIEAARSIGQELHEENGALRAATLIKQMINL